MRPETAVQTGIMGLLGGGRTAAQRLIAHEMDVNALRTNALLRKDEWKDLDEAVVRVARQKLSVVNALRSRNLTRNLGDLGTMLAEYERQSDMTAAEQTMSGVAPGERDTPDFDLKSVPVPITFKDFQLNVRRLTASRRRGESLDVSAGELAAALVAEKLEDTVINGSTVVIGGSTAYGLKNHPDRITGSLSQDWDGGSATGETILTDVLAMVKAAEAKNYYGPFIVVVGTSYNSELRKDFKANSDKTVRQRLLEEDAIDDILISAKLAADNVLLFQPTSNVVQLGVAQDIVTIEWDDMGGLIQLFKVMAAVVPIVKSDKESQSGVVHYTP